MKCFLCIIAIFAGAAAESNAALITFSGLTGANNSPFTTYSEAGFNVTTTAGTFLQGQVFGGPVPDIFTRSSGTIDVTQTSLKPFTFAGFDIASANALGNIGTYSYQGFLAGALVFSGSGSTSTSGNFTTIASSSPTALIDNLFITASVANNVSTNLDNINVSPASVPEPASVLLCGLAGVVGLGVARMRRCRV